MVEPDRHPHDGSSTSSDRRRWIVVTAVGLAGVLTGWVFGFTSSPPPTSTNTAEDPIAISPTSTTPDTTTIPTFATTTPTTSQRNDAPLRGRVELLPGSLDLRGSIALAVPASEGDQNLWLIEPGGRMVQRVDAHIRPGGHRYPMMIVGDYLLITSSAGTFRTRLDLTEHAVKVEESAILIPDDSANRSWLVGGDLPEWFALFDGETGEVGQRTSIPNDFGWPFAGYESGVLFYPNEPSVYGPVAHWPLGGEPSRLDVELDAQSGIISVVGHLGVIVSPGPRLQIVNLQTGERTTSLPFEPGQGNVVGVCLSEDAGYVAAISSTGEVEVFETATGESRGRLSTSDPPFSVGWVAPNQLVTIVDVEGAASSSLQLFNAAAGLATPIASLATPAAWRMATSSRPC